MTEKLDDWEWALLGLRAHSIIGMTTWKSTSGFVDVLVTRCGVEIPRWENITNDHDREQKAFRLCKSCLKRGG